MTEPTFAEMISKIAHELRSPLTSIKGFSATLVKRWDRFSDDQKLQFMETILSDANRMSRIITEVLDLARFEAGQLELMSADAHLASVVDKAVSDIEAVPGVERVKVDVPDDITVWADVDRLERIVATLVENGVKFSEDGPVELKASLEGDKVIISVTDRGVGIEPERIDSIFSGPGPAGQMAGPRGTGLGLFLARRLVDAHQGNLAVDSTPGKGSTFTLTLPKKAKDSAA